MKITPALKKYYRTIIWSILMFYALFSPAKALPETGLFNIPHFDKLIHFGMFSILVFFLYLDSEKQPEFKKFLRLLFLILTPVFSVLSEVIQYYFIVGRSGNIYDFLADIAGLTTGVLFYILFWKKTFRFSSSPKKL
jgi:VanZ family protein